MNLLVPCRLNFLGGWSDQACWTGPAAVVNASVGWYGGNEEWQHDPYPCIAYDGKFETKVDGIGTGLGISSIRDAALYCMNPDRRRIAASEYTTHALREEEKRGTLGGWQDAVGALEPGMKVLSRDGTKMNVGRFADDRAQEILELCVLFDTGIRRDSGEIGNKVRALIEAKDKAFCDALKANVKDAMDPTAIGADRFAERCIVGYQRLCAHVPEMDVDLPHIAGTHGYMLMGAGGGGFGIYFLNNPRWRETVSEDIRCHGFETMTPVLLKGYQYAETSERTTAQVAVAV